jgi:hypothetical protein
MQTGSHEPVRIFGGHLGVQLHIHGAEMLLESESRRQLSAQVACGAR